MSNSSGQAARLLTRLAQAIGRHVLRADKIHGDDTPTRVLGGKAKTGQLWVYVPGHPFCDAWFEAPLPD